MRQAHLRTLATRGIEVVRPLRIWGLEVYEAIDERGDNLLILSGGVIGPSWAGIGFVLEEFQIKHHHLSLGKTYILSPDTAELRSLLKQLHGLAKTSAQKEIFVPDVGFLVSDLAKKFDARVLIAPAIILACTLAVWHFQSGREVPEVEAIEPIGSISCALDLPEAEFQAWFKDQFENADKKVNELVIQSDLAIVNLQFVQSLGSTQLVNAEVQCQDGRAQKLQFRTDSQRGGDLVELGQRLDS